MDGCSACRRRRRYDRWMLIIIGVNAIALVITAVAVITSVVSA